jgi:hypothetical protein
VVAAEWLNSYDNYYYDRHTSFDLGLPQPVKTLPVLRVKFDDPRHTWLYVAPSNGQILKFEGIERANRWGYYALHSFDYGFLFRHRPVWDVVVLILLGGVAVIAGSSLLPAWRRLRRTVRRADSRGGGEHSPKRFARSPPPAEPAQPKPSTIRRSAAESK